MHARSTTVHGDPAALERGTAYVRDESMPVLRGMILPALVLSITLLILLYTVYPYTEQER